LGPRVIVEYFIRALPTVTAAYHGDPSNFSIWTMGDRLWHGIGPGSVTGTRANPLLGEHPVAARFATLGLVAGVIDLGVASAVRAGRADLPIAAAICVGVLTSPLVWTYYLLLAIVPVGILTNDVHRRGWPTLQAIALVVAAASLIPAWFNAGAADASGLLSPQAALLSMLPTLGLCLLLLVNVCCARADSGRRERPSNQERELAQGWLRRTSVRRVGVLRRQNGCRPESQTMAKRSCNRARI
jgi:hypothetical protein